MKTKKEIYLYRPAPKKPWRYKERIYTVVNGRKVVKKTVNRSLDTHDETVARDLAYADYLREHGADNGTLPRRTVLRSGAPTINDLLARYKQIVKHSNISRDTVTGNAAALVRLLSTVFPHQDVGALRTDVLSHDLVIKWRDLKRAGAKDDGKRLNITLNSELAKAQHVFAKAAREHLYKDFDLQSIDGFLKVPRLDQPDMRFRPIPKDDLARMDAALAAYPKQISADTPPPPNASVVVIVELARYCGLRASEIEALRWHWFEDRGEEGLFLGIFHRPADPDQGITEYEPKAREGWVSVDRELYQRWRQLIPPADPQAYVITAVNATERRHFVKYAANAWVAPFLPADRTKRLHELRKQFGAEIATQYGIYAAAEALRDSVQVAEKHYASLTKAVPALSPKGFTASAK